MQRTGILTLALLFGACAAAVAQEAELLSESAGGVLEIEGETHLEIEGLRGKIHVRQGKAGEIRFAARDLEDRQAERPVALWVEGRVLRVMPLEGQPDEPLRLEVSVGPDLAASVEASDSVVQLSSLHGEVRVQGERLEVIGRMIDGSLDLRVAESTLQVVTVSEGLSVDGEAIQARLEGVSGLLELRVDGGTLRLHAIHGEIDAELENVELTANAVVGGIRLDADTGSVELIDCRAGAELRLSDAPLQLSATKGPIRVDTDSEVRFHTHEGPLNIRGNGAAVNGGQASGGALEIETSGVDVTLQECEAATVIRGDNLNVHVSGGKGELTVSTTYSEILVEKAEQGATVENEFGDVKIRDASQLVKVSSRDGDVRLEALRGPAEVKADGVELSVGWAALDGTHVSSLENARGDVRVSVPTGVRCEIEGQAPHGRIETDLTELSVSDDGHEVRGVLLGGRGRAAFVKRPSIRIESGGDLYVHAASPSGSGAQEE
jgi:DUF4097 and DUF4098 domain-containing protein YvlB